MMSRRTRRREEWRKWSEGERRRGRYEQHTPKQMGGNGGGE